MMDLIVDVLLEVFSIVLMGFICFTIYVNGKIFLINIGLIDKNKMINQLKFKYRKGVNKKGEF
tara:strand:- start:479 stop:667 length:189 start_codon:yes stop_codon:yes gene_type:complete